MIRLNAHAEVEAGAVAPRFHRLMAEQALVWLNLVLRLLAKLQDRR